MTGASNDSDEKPASAAASLDGYFYQLDVSVWIALELVLARQVASEVILEPSTQEDLEANLGEDTSLDMVEQVPLADYRLIVQCKLRRTGPWKDQVFINLLEHGTRRTSVAERLKKARSRYLLVTNADVDGVARNVIMDTFLVWPPTNEIPKDIARHLPQDASGRVAILSNVDQEKLTARTGDYLQNAFACRTVGPENVWKRYGKRPWRVCGRRRAALGLAPTWSTSSNRMTDMSAYPQSCTSSCSRRISMN